MKFNIPGQIRLPSLYEVRKLSMAEFYDRNGNPLTVSAWAELFGDIEYKMVASTDIGNIKVSSVWLGINHNYNAAGRPLVFETMVFGGDMDEKCNRYSTEAACLRGHKNMVREVRESVDLAEEFARIEQMEVDKAMDRIRSKYMPAR